MDKKNFIRKIIFGSDHAGYLLKEALKLHLSTDSNENKYEIIDCGPFSESKVDYPDYAKAVALEVIKNPENRGILVCGTGIGISIAANKLNGIRCGLVHDHFTAQLSRDHNDCNVVAIGAGLIGKELAKNIVDVFLSTKFSEGERHITRIEKIRAIEKEN
jgi:ribose 5-phosphate isomerase B